MLMMMCRKSIDAATLLTNNKLITLTSMARNSLLCANVPLRNYSLTVDECRREDVPVCGVENYRTDIETVLVKLQACCSQFDIDGTHNVWIVKPGAKSRGRGK